ncbi:MAG: metallophosphoesterase [Acidobacteriia bacterium]|nr:metallophosphoesterase [Terriglobia bacterium]
MTHWLIHWIARNLSDLVVFTGILLIQAIGLRWLLRSSAAHASRRTRVLILAAGAVSLAAIVFGFLLKFFRVARLLSPWWSSWGRGAIFGWAFTSILLVIALAITRLLPHSREHSPARRRFLRATNYALLGAPAAAMGYGVFIERKNLRMREQSIAIPGLHPDLDGLKLVQLTDIHLSTFLPEEVLARAVDLANETRAHVALVTGDLISFQGDPLDTCLKHLARLRADAGIFGCLGNHEIYAGTERYTTEAGARLGMRFLRSKSAELRFGNAKLNLAGVDYQHLGRPYLTGAEEMIRPDALNLLMSHNPDVFPVAAEQGWDVTLAGHTHGGQISVEILHQNMSIARFFTPYVDGLYRQGSASIFVSRGIGTIGLPARLGAPPEVALVTLCRI